MRAAHWDTAYAEGAAAKSWHEPEAAASLRLLTDAGVRPEHTVVDVGGGASPLVDGLLDRGHRAVSVLDVSEAALTITCQRLGRRAGWVTWLPMDLLSWSPTRPYAAWHDRAVFHFLTTQEERAAYRSVLEQATRPGSVLVLGTFAPDGPETCSGLPVARYDADGLARELGPQWRVEQSERRVHVTPWEAKQPFTWLTARRESRR